VLKISEQMIYGELFLYCIVWLCSQFRWYSCRLEWGSYCPSKVL